MTLADVVYDGVGIHPCIVSRRFPGRREVFFQCMNPGPEDDRFEVQRFFQYCRFSRSHLNVAWVYQDPHHDADPHQVWQPVASRAGTAEERGAAIRAGRGMYVPETIMIAGGSVSRRRGRSRASRIHTD